MPGRDANLFFDVPGATLRFSSSDLEQWAEHLAWCYGVLGLRSGCTLAVQDFGNSPLSFLGSAMLMPGLERGVAEHLRGRFICLDASAERVTLTPALLTQVTVDALVVRADVMGLLDAELAKKARGREQMQKMPQIVVALGLDDPSPHGDSRSLHYLLNEPAKMLMAPQCPSCGVFHLRGGFYDSDGPTIHNLRYDCEPFEVSGAEILIRGFCGSEDLGLRFCAAEGDSKSL